MKISSAAQRFSSLGGMLNAVNRGHYRYNDSSERGELVCNGHFPQDSAEIVCLDEKSATWLRANATFPSVRWHHARITVVDSTADAVRIVGKAVGDGLRVTTNHIPAVGEADPTRDDAEPRPGVNEPAEPAYSSDGPAGPGYYFERTPGGKVYLFEPGAPEHEKAVNTVQEMVRKLIVDMGRNWAWLDFGNNYVPHDYQFDSPDFFNFLKKRKYATYHDAQMHGYVPRTKDFFLLMGQLVRRMGVLKADQEMIIGLRRGRTNEGAPLAMKDNSSGYKLVGLREFKVVSPDVLAKLRADGSLQRCLDGGIIFEAQSGVYIELIEVYAHPKIAAHLKKTVADTYATVVAEWKHEDG